MRYTKLLFTAVATLLVSEGAQAQISLAPYVGFKSYGLKGATTSAAGGQIQQLGIFDGGKTSFTFGVGIGHRLLKVPGGIYELDMQLDVSYASANFAEAGYNSSFGSGKYSADGNSGGSTSNLAFDLMPIHRISIPGFSLLTPYAGVGLGLNYFSTSNISVGPPSSPQTIAVNGTSQFKIGFLIFYGVDLNIVPVIHPFLQFKHYIPFGSEFQLTDDSKYGSIVVKDVPGYFNLVAGIRFDL
jgi:opacity protein-like surface antigen